MLRLDNDHYYSLDNDPRGNFDYKAFEEIPRKLKFELIVASQFFEHLTIDEANFIMWNIYHALTDNGLTAITVPNAQHPVRFWGDPTHVTSWPYQYIYSLVKNNKLRIKTVARYTKYKFPRNPIKKYIIRSVCDIFRIDWCDSILVVAQKMTAK